ncbi:MAG: hypothetical protein J5I93_08430 [Pirellulaceae bacterium]|nr:hypothetical protein [Pirellulaceae bacterium]
MFSSVRWILIACCLLASNVARAQQQAPFPDPNRIYEIKEPTRNERVAVGSDNNVVRWVPNGKLDQQFRFISDGAGAWRIQSLKHGGGHYLNVEAGGNVTVELRSENWKGQRFRLEPQGGNKVRIREGTKNEFVAVGSNGNILRWDSGDILFELVPVEVHERPSLTETYVYEIKELTQDERVAVGSNDNILRWERTGGAEQKFLFIPVGDFTWQIVSMQHGRYMAVDPIGNILAYDHNGAADQTFKIREGSELRKTVLIVEQTKEEYVTVAGQDNIRPGNVLRWGQLNNLTQEFQLIPIKLGTKPDLPKTETLPDPPAKLDAGQPVLTTAAKLIAVEALPAVLTYDPEFGHKARHQQVSKHPYYIIKRFQYWDATGSRGAKENRDGKTKQTITTTITHGWTKSHLKSARETFSISGTAGLTAGAEAKGGKAEGSLSVTVGYSLEKLDQAEQSEMSSTEKTVTEEIPMSDTPYLYCLWSKVDRFEVWDAKQTRRVSTWEFVTNEQFERTYPLPE